MAGVAFMVEEKSEFDAKRVEILKAVCVYCKDQDAKKEYGGELVKYLGEQRKKDVLDWVASRVRPGDPDYLPEVKLKAGVELVRLASEDNDLKALLGIIRSSDYYKETRDLADNELPKLMENAKKANDFAPLIEIANTQGLSEGTLKLVNSEIPKVVEAKIQELRNSKMAPYDRYSRLIRISSNSDVTDDYRVSAGVAAVKACAENPDSNADLHSMKSWIQRTDLLDAVRESAAVALIEMMDRGAPSRCCGGEGDWNYRHFGVIFEWKGCPENVRAEAIKRFQHSVEDALPVLEKYGEYKEVEWISGGAGLVTKAIKKNAKDRLQHAAENAIVTFTGNGDFRSLLDMRMDPYLTKSTIKKATDAFPIALKNAKPDLNDISETGLQTLMAFVKDDRLSMKGRIDAGNMLIQHYEGMCDLNKLEELTKQVPDEVAKAAKESINRVGLKTLKPPEDKTKTKVNQRG